MASDFMTLFTPKGRILQVLKGADELLYLDAKSVEQLFADLPEPEEFGRSGAPASLMINAAFSMRLQIAAVRVESSRSEAGVTHVGHAGLGESVLGDIGNVGATDMGRAGRESAFCEISAKKVQPRSAHNLPQDVPPPPTAVGIVRTTEEWRLRQDRLKKLRQIFQDECRYPDLPTYNLKKSWTSTSACPTNTISGRATSTSMWRSWATSTR